MPEKLLLSYHDLTIRLNLSRTALWGLVRRGEFPAPIKIGRSVRFRESDVTEWIAAQAPVSETAAQTASQPPADDISPAGAPAAL